MEILSNRKEEHNTVVMTFKADAAELEQAVEKAYQRRKNSLSIPGFRKGKVPRKMIERQYGENFFYEEAVQSLYQQSVIQAVEDEDLDVVSAPNVEVTELTKENGVVIKATFTLRPKAEISGYKGLTVEDHNHPVTDEDIAKEIDKLKEKTARLVDVERAAQKGDQADFDFKGSVDGVPFEGGAAEHYKLELGSGLFIPGFEEQIIGHNPGDEFDVKVTFPADYHAEELAGKEAVFACKLHQIQEKQFPAVDDEFAKDVSEFETLDSLKDDLRRQLEEKNKKHAEEHFEDSIAEQLIAKIGDEVEIPQMMFDNRTDELMSEWETRNRERGLSIDNYLRYSGQTKEEFREMFKDPAQKQVKLRLALEAVARAENIAISDERINEEYEKIAAQYKIDIKRVRAAISERSLKGDLMAEEALNIVRTSAVKVPHSGHGEHADHAEHDSHEE
jgi:trigger factor